MKKRILTLALALVMCLSLIPVTTLATGDTITITGAQADIVLANVYRETTETFAPISISSSVDTQETVYWFNAATIDAEIVKLLPKDDAMDAKWCDIVVVELMDDGKYHFIAGGEFDLEALEDGALVFGNEIVESLRKSYVENDWVVQCTFGGAIFNIGFTSEVGDPPTPEAPSSWATEQVNAAIAAGLVPENLQKNYTSPVSRGSVAQMFISLVEKTAGQPIDDYLAAKGVAINSSAFSDTTDKAVLAANALGLINGVGGGRFDLEGTLTRAQIAAIINRYAILFGVNTSGYEHGFTDVSGHWVSSELGWPVHAGIVNGVGGGKYDPEGKLTTEQAIAITYRALLADKTNTAAQTAPTSGADFVDGVTYDTVLKPYAESLGYTCSYSTENLYVENRFRVAHFMDFSNGTNRVRVKIITPVEDGPFSYLIYSGAAALVQQYIDAGAIIGPGIFVTRNTDDIKARLSELA